ncbi:hypothetical protein [Methylobacter luteus]|uniref:hypothetical protein n=1 Tax=Methylobacter luteus TaxID=415 RepID=UPI0004175F63|nr:hypothetical protein [Methylobacter luteus]
MVTDDFVSELNDWDGKLSDDEWYFCKLRERLVNSLNQEEAFNQIPSIVEVILKNSDEFVCMEGFELLLSIVRKSETTEAPPKLKEQWEILKAHMNQFGDYEKRKFDELSHWYRINAL